MSSKASRSSQLTLAAAPKRRMAVSARGAATVVAAAAGKVTIVDAAVADPQFSILVEAVTKAGLASALSGGSFTVFAPTNDAFAKV